MPRIVWRPLIAALVAIPLASCFYDSTDCPTCPPENSSRIEVLVKQNGLVDSVQAQVDGGAPVKVRRNRLEDRRYTFDGLNAGTHSVTVTRWFFADDLVTSRTSTFQIVLSRGEARTIVFHNDFPLIAGSPEPAPRAVAHAPVCGAAARRTG